jgi:hypothetical protein
MAANTVQMKTGVTPGLSPAFGHEITLYVPAIVRIRHLPKRTMYSKCSKNAGILDCHKNYRKESLPIQFHSLSNMTAIQCDATAAKMTHRNEAIDTRLILNLLAAK